MKHLKSSSFFSQSEQDNLLIWDSSDKAPVGNWNTILWSSYEHTDDSDVISISRLVEEQANSLRSRYLSWIYDLGETCINEKKLIDHLELRSGFSYWWMTAMTQKFNFSDKSIINDAIKLLALEDFINKKKVNNITLVSGNKRIAQSLEGFCKKLNYQYQFIKTPSKSIGMVKKSYKKIPFRFQALIFLLRYLKRNSPFLFKKQNTSLLDGNICLLGPLVHLDKNAFTSGVFISNYWTRLVDFLSDSNVKSNWLHNFYSYKEISSPKQALNLIQHFNKSEGQMHSMVESNLSAKVLKGILVDYYRLNKVKRVLSTIRKNFNVTDSNIDLWPLFKNEWNESLSGTSAVINCIRLSLYEKTLKSIPHQKKGIYIQENQQWEMALIYAWKKMGHGKLIGVPHATVRFWDLRYFYDPRSYEQLIKNCLPVPDIVAINSSVAKELYLDGGYPTSQISEVEALRYFHLNQTKTTGTKVKSQDKALKVLICGDFSADTNYNMLSWMSQAANNLPRDTKYFIKPHPAYPVKLNDFPTLKLKLTKTTLTELFNECDVVFTSNSASAAVDAYCYGVAVIQMLDGKSLNSSPLRGLRGVVYAKNPKELSESILKSTTIMKSESYFFLDEELPRWQKLLGC